MVPNLPIYRRSHELSPYLPILLDLSSISLGFSPPRTTSSTLADLAWTLADLVQTSVNLTRTLVDLGSPWSTSEHSTESSDSHDLDIGKLTRSTLVVLGRPWLFSLNLSLRYSTSICFTRPGFASLDFNRLHSTSISFTRPGSASLDLDLPFADSHDFGPSFARPRFRHSLDFGSAVPIHMPLAMTLEFLLDIFECQHMPPCFQVNSYDPENNSQVILSSNDVITSAIRILRAMNTSAIFVLRAIHVSAIVWRALGLLPNTWEIFL